MGEAKVTVELAALEGGPRELQVGGARLAPNGIDRAELLIAPNRGATCPARSGRARGRDSPRDWTGSTAKDDCERRTPS